MPFLSFNTEPTRAEEAVRFRVFTEGGLVKVRMERAPATTLVLTLLPSQAETLATMLKKECRASSPVADRRPRLAEDRR